MSFACRNCDRRIGCGRIILRLPRLVSDASSVAAKTVEKIGIMAVDARFKLKARYTLELISPGVAILSTVCFESRAIRALKASPIQGSFWRTAFINSAVIRRMTAPMLIW